MYGICRSIAGYVSKGRTGSRCIVNPMNCPLIFVKVNCPLKTKTLPRSKISTKIPNWLAPSLGLWLCIELSWIKPTGVWHQTTTCPFSAPCGWFKLRFRWWWEEVLGNVSVDNSTWWFLRRSSNCFKWWCPWHASPWHPFRCSLFTLDVSFLSLAPF